MTTITDIMKVVLHFYLAVTPKPDKMFLNTLQYLACENGCPSGEEMNMVRIQIINDWKMEKELSKRRLGK